MEKKLLKGIDFFQLLIDKHARRKGGVGHIVRLKLEVEGQLQEDFLRANFQKNKLLQKVARARISTNFGIGYPYLFFQKTPADIPIIFNEFNSESTLHGLLNGSLDARKDCPFRVDFFYPNNQQTTLVFSLHHILFDHVGVQNLLASINNPLLDIPLFTKVSAKGSFRKKWIEFFRAVGFAFREGTRKMTVLKRKLPAQRPLESNFFEVVFSEEETALIYKNAQKYGAGFNKSSFFLAAVVQSFHLNVFSKQDNHDFFWIPVPVNDRAKGTTSHLLFNGLTFLFYKLKNTECNDLQQIIISLQRQMKTQIKEKLPAAFISFVDAYRFVPLPIYYWQMQLPSWGKLNSFSFSYLGDSFPNLTEFLGHPVQDITHYPSNVVRPGMTVIFYQFKGKLRMVIGLVKGDFSPSETNEIINKTRGAMSN